jgi:hypothetical protein
LKDVRANLSFGEPDLKELERAREAACGDEEEIRPVVEANILISAPIKSA